MTCPYFQGLGLEPQTAFDCRINTLSFAVEHIYRDMKQYFRNPEFTKSFWLCKALTGLMFRKVSSFMNYWVHVYCNGQVGETFGQKAPTSMLTQVKYWTDSNHEMQLCCTLSRHCAHSSLSHLIFHFLSKLLCKICRIIFSSLHRAVSSPNSLSFQLLRFGISEWRLLSFSNQLPIFVLTKTMFFCPLNIHLASPPVNCSESLLIGRHCVLPSVASLNFFWFCCKVARS